MNAESGTTHACLWAYSPDGELLWVRQSPVESSRYWAVASTDETIVAVGSVSGGGSSDCVIEKWGIDGTLIWTRQIDLGGAEDVLRGVALADGTIYAVGHTRGNTKGGADAIILEVNDADGRLLTTTRYGGVNEDVATAVAIVGKDLYVVGESRSFDGENDMVWGQNMPGENNEVMLLRYAVSPGRHGLRWR
jgi:hypothetical protein